MTRKNANGSRNEDAARLAARIWTVTATAEMAGLNVLTYLTAYLDACGRNGGKPLSGRTWNGSCRGTLPPPTWAPRRNRPRPADPARYHHGVTVTKRSRRLSACPLTRLPNTHAFRADGARRHGCAFGKDPLLGRDFF